jgi:hypothetical protein
MTAKARKSADASAKPDFVDDLLSDEGLWQLAAPEIRDRMAQREVRQKYVQNIFVADQATVSRFLNGSLAPRIAGKPDKLRQLLKKLELDPVELEMEIAHRLCCNPECASQFFHAEYEKAVAFPQLAPLGRPKTSPLW